MRRQKKLAFHSHAELRRNLQFSYYYFICKISSFEILKTKFVLTQNVEKFPSHYVMSNSLKPCGNIFFKKAITLLKFVRKLA